MMSIYTETELQDIGFAHCGRDVRISRKASIYNPGNITIGSHVRIDDFCVLSAGDGGIEICSYVHIAVYCSLIGAGNIKLEEFSGLSSRVTIYSSNDDYSGEFLTNPTVSKQFTNVSHKGVHIGRHVIVGSGSVILPGVELEQGVAIGALSLVQNRCEEFWIYQGVPARRIKERKRDLLALEVQFLHHMNSESKP